MNRTIRIGVGLIPGFDKAIANSYTTSTEHGDFTSRAANTAGFNFNNPQPIILVIKKNASVLNRLFNWLQTQSIHDVIANKSLLLVDDEADNASINTSRDGDDPTAINKTYARSSSYSTGPLTWVTRPHRLPTSSYHSTRTTFSRRTLSSTSRLRTTTSVPKRSSGLRQIPTGTKIFCPLFPGYGQRCVRPRQTQERRPEADRG